MNVREKLRPGSSLRVRLLGLIGISVLPIFVLLLIVSLNQRQALSERVQQDALRLAGAAGSQQREMMSATRGLLRTLARVPAVERGGPECHDLLASVMGDHPDYANLGVADASGIIRCSALPLSGEIGIGDRSYFRQAMQRDEFSVGEFQTGRVTARPSLNFGYPIRGAGSKPVAVIYAAIDLQALNRASRNWMSKDATLIVTDVHQTVLVHSDRPSSAVGEPLAIESMREIPWTTKEGLLRATGADGTTRLFGFSTIHTDGTFLRVWVGLPVETALESYRRAIAGELGAVALVCLLALVAGWLGAHHLVVRHLALILRSTRGGCGRRLHRPDRPFAGGYGAQQVGWRL